MRTGHGLVIGIALLAAGCSEPRGTNAAAAAPAPATAMTGSQHGGMAAPATGDSPATAGFKRSMTAMMEDAPPYTGDADTDFMQQMRVHHEAAITMSETQLAHGRDPAARALAQAVIREQRREIAEIDAWLAARRR